MRWLTQIVEEISIAMLESECLDESIVSDGGFRMRPAGFAKRGKDKQDHVRHCRKKPANVGGRWQGGPQKAPAHSRYHDRLLHRLRRFSSLHRILSNRSLHVLGAGRRSSAVRPDRSRSVSLYWLSEMHEQRTRRCVSGWLSVGCDRDGTNRRLGSRARNHASRSTAATASSLGAN